MSDKDLKKIDAESAEGTGVISAPCWKTGYAQHIGSRREQQDKMGTVWGSFHGRPALLAVLADGMGGMENGAAFSRIAVDFQLENFQRILDSAKHLPYVLLSLALQANAEAHKIYDENKPGGTTLVTALFFDDRFYTLSVGDSRICLYRRNEKLGSFVPLQLNREHVLGAALDESAWMGRISFDDAENNMYRASLTSSIGGSRIRHIDLAEHPTRFIIGDRVALMSDGVYGALTEMEIAADMEKDPAEAAAAIVRHVCGKKIPHQDNMSILIVERI